MKRGEVKAWVRTVACNGDSAQKGENKGVSRLAGGVKAAPMGVFLGSCMWLASASLTAQTSDCTPSTTVLHFDGGYEVSMCYRTPQGDEGQAKSGIWASGESGLLWFFNRDNAEVLVKVLDGCAVNGHRWVFVAPVTDLEFNLWVTGPTGRRWTHSNRQGVTASTKSDTSAFSCSPDGDNDNSGPGPDLVVQSPSVSDTSLTAGQSFTLRATVRNQGDSQSAATTLRYYRSSNSTISSSDTQVGTDAISALSSSGSSPERISLTAPSSAGTYYYGACVEAVSSEANTANNCSTAVRVTVTSGTGGDAYRVEGVECSRNVFTSRVEITGTLRANRSLRNVQVRGYVRISPISRGELVGSASLGNVAAGQTRTFSITGTSGIATSCYVQVIHD